MGRTWKAHGNPWHAPKVDAGWEAPDLVRQGGRRKVCGRHLQKRPVHFSAFLEYLQGKGEGQGGRAMGGPEEGPDPHLLAPPPKAARHVALEVQRGSFELAGGWNPQEGGVTLRAVSDAYDFHQQVAQQFLQLVPAACHSAWPLGARRGPQGASPRRNEARHVPGTRLRSIVLPLASKGLAHQHVAPCKTPIAIALVSSRSLSQASTAFVGHPLPSPPCTHRRRNRY